MSPWKRRTPLEKGDVWAVSEVSPSNLPTIFHMSGLFRNQNKKADPNYCTLYFTLQKTHPLVLLRSMIFRTSQHGICYFPEIEPFKTSPEATSTSGWPRQLRMEDFHSFDGYAGSSYSSVILGVLSPPKVGLLQWKIYQTSICRVHVARIYYAYKSNWPGTYIYDMSGIQWRCTMKPWSHTIW